MQKVIAEKEAENFLEKEGFKVAERTFAKTADSLKSIKIKFPWVMKISSKKIIHKAKIGGIALNIKNIKEAENAFNKLSKIKDFEEALIQPMIKGEELIIGVKKTPEFNQVIMFGKGGRNVEQEKDVSFRVLPITEKEAEQMIKEIKFYSILKSKKINLEAVKENLIKMSKFAENHPKISELDINPLLTDNKNAIVIDARIVFEG